MQAAVMAREGSWARRVFARYASGLLRIPEDLLGGADCSGTTLVLCAFLGGELREHPLPGTCFGEVQEKALLLRQLLGNRRAAGALPALGGLLRCALDAFAAFSLRIGHPVLPRANAAGMRRRRDAADAALRAFESSGLDPIAFLQQGGGGAAAAAAPGNDPLLPSGDGFVVLSLPERIGRMQEAALARQVAGLGDPLAGSVASGMRNLMLCPSCNRAASVVNEPTARGAAQQSGVTIVGARLHCDAKVKSARKDRCLAPIVPIDLVGSTVCGLARFGTVSLCPNCAHFSSSVFLRRCGGGSLEWRCCVCAAAEEVQAPRAPKKHVREEGVRAAAAPHGGPNGRKGAANRGAGRPQRAGGKRAKKG